MVVVVVVGVVAVVGVVGIGVVFGHDGLSCVACSGFEVVGVVCVEFVLYGITDLVGDPWVCCFGGSY